MVLLPICTGQNEGRGHDCKMLTWSGQAWSINCRDMPSTLLVNPYASTGTQPTHYVPTYRHLSHWETSPLSNDSSTNRWAQFVFGDILNWFAFMDFKRKSKIYLSAVGKMYLVCALLTNARTCMYGNLTSEYFEIEPPTIQNYFM